MNLISKHWPAVVAALLLLPFFMAPAVGGQARPVAPRRAPEITWSTGLSMHNISITAGAQTITTAWHGPLGDDHVTTERAPDELAVDWIRRHYDAVKAAQQVNVPD